MTQPIRMQFRLPPTFYAGDGQRLELALNYAYSDGMAATSALVVVVNGIAANMIRLDNPRGAIIDGARLNLTLGMFHPGINTISILPMLDPASDAACLKPGAVLSLFDDSRISMPEFARLARGGDLQDLVDDAYPYGDEPTQVIVSGKDQATVAAAYTFLGKLAQRHGEILDNLEFVPTTAMPKDHLIAVGTPDDLPVSLLSRLDVPWRPGEDDATPVAANGSGDPTAVPVAASIPDPRDSWRSRLLDQNMGDDGSLMSRLRTIMISGASAEGDGTTLVRSARPAAPGAGGAMLVEVASPWVAQKIATVLVADRPDNFQRGLAAIIAEPRWSELGGDRARWQPRDNDVISERMNATFLLQEPEPDPVQWRLMALTWLAQNRWTWLGLIIGALASASMATSLLLRMRRH